MPTQHKRRSQRTGVRHVQTSGFTRSLLNEAELEKIDIAARMCSQFKWESARPFQVEGTRAQLLGKNAVIHASTGKGKTAVAAGPHTIPGMQGRVTLFVAPLLALHTEMTKTFKSKFGLSAIAVNSLIERGTKDLFKEIIEGKYQIVILAPEMLLHRRFVDAVLKSRQFRQRVLSVVVDEAHCISHWGDNFRKLYGMLGNVRAFLLPRTSIVAMSGTLTRRVRRDICKKLGFSSSGSDYIFIDEGNARTNVFIASLPMQHPIKSYRDLDFIISPDVKSVDDIQKTMVYSDDKDVIYEIVDHVRSLLPPSVAPECIRPFTASHTPDYRESAMDAFVAGSIRVLVCTEAAGMGCDISDIDLIVQWKAAKLLGTFVQRAGRAARDRTRIGVAIQFVEPNAYRVNPTEEQPPKPKKPKSKRGRKKKNKGSGPAEPVQGTDNAGETQKIPDQGFKSDIPAEPEVRDDSPGEGIYCFIQTTLCRRRIWDLVFGNTQKNELSVPCCDLCDPSFLDRFHFAPGQKISRNAKIPKGEIDPDLVQALESWRELVFERDYPTAPWESSALLDDSLIHILASIGPVTNLEQIKRALGPRWAHSNKYGNDIFSVLTSGDTGGPRPAVEATGPDHDTDANERPLKRQRICAPAQSTNSPTKRKAKLAEHETMFDDWKIQAASQSEASQILAPETYTQSVFSASATQLTRTFALDSSSVHNPLYASSSTAIRMDQRSTQLVAGPSYRQSGVPLIYTPSAPSQPVPSPTPNIPSVRSPSRTLYHGIAHTSHPYATARSRSQRSEASLTRVPEWRPTEMRLDAAYHAQTYTPTYVPSMPSHLQSWPLYHAPIPQNSWVSYSPLATVTRPDFVAAQTTSHPPEETHYAGVLAAGYTHAAEAYLYNQSYIPPTPSNGRGGFDYAPSGSRVNHPV